MNTDEQAIRDVIERWHRATAAGDVDTILTLMSEDVVFLVAGKPTMEGRGAFEQGLRTLLKTHRIESSAEIQEIEVSGDLAYCRSLLNVNITPLSGGETNIRTGSVLSIFRKRDGSWQLARDANLLPSPS